jgi:hypothetical protein
VQLITEREAKVLREEREGRRLDVETTNDRDQQIQAIEESFRLSKLMPVHQTKPELEPVEIIPLLPDFDRVADQFVHIVFDTDPLAEADALTDLDQEARYELESRVCFTCLAFQKAPLSNYKMESEQGINYAALFTKEVKTHQDMPPIANCQKQMVQLQDCSGRILMVIF